MSPPDAPLLEARDITCGYNPRHPVLKGVSLTLGRGEILGVLGPNGAGKSTLVRALAGLCRPTSGAVYLGGQDMAGLRRAEIARGVALVPQRERVPGELTVRAVVAMGRAPHTGWFGVLGRRDRTAIDRALDRCDAAQFADRPYGALSGGEQKRVLVARALAQEAPVVLLDEPIAFLDIGHQLALCDLLAAGAARGEFSAVAVLHDLNLAAQYCHRLLLLRDGVPVALGTVPEVMTWQRIRDCFDADVYVGVNELNGTGFFVPMRPNR